MGSVICGFWSVGGGEAIKSETTKCMTAEKHGSIHYHKLIASSVSSSTCVHMMYYIANVLGVPSS